jgi:adenine/guanine phosphoribosyltransferase-like PRPP-binding protein
MALDWQRFDALCDTLVERLGGDAVDLIVGVSRGGLPPAVALAHRLGCRGVGVILATRSNSDAAFDIGDTVGLSPALLPVWSGRRVIVVDDIIQTGELAQNILDVLAVQFGPNVDCTFVSLFADITAIQDKGFARLLPNLIYAEDIDNQRIWVDFPWEQPV